MTCKGNIIINMYEMYRNCSSSTLKCFLLLLLILLYPLIFCSGPYSSSGSHGRLTSFKTVCPNWNGVLLRVRTLHWFHSMDWIHRNTDIKLPALKRLVTGQILVLDECFLRLGWLLNILLSYSFKFIVIYSYHWKPLSFDTDFNIICSSAQVLAWACCNGGNLLQ